MVAPGGVSVVAPGGRAWLLGVCMVAPRGACVVAPGGACVVAPGGHAWQRGACVVKGGGGGMCGEGGVHGKGGACVANGGHVVCTPHEIRPVIARAVRILLECILVQFYFYHMYCKPYCPWTTHLNVIIVGLFIPQVNLPDFDCDIVFPTVMEPGER